MKELLRLTAILGASPKPERYAYLAMKTFEEKGVPFFLVNPHYSEIEGRTVFSQLSEISEPLDTISLYISAENQPALLDSIIKKHPRRVIFNPGSESAASVERLQAHGIECLEACTLVLLKTNQYFQGSFDKKMDRA